MHRKIPLLSATFVIAVLALTWFSTSSYLILPAFAHQCPIGALNCPAEGRMTGGGRINTESITVPLTPGTIVTHGFELHCKATDLPNGLEVNWNTLAGLGSNRFHLETLNDALCWDDPAISPNPPNAPFDSMTGDGFGRYNGQSGAYVYFYLTDAGEPGQNDWAYIHVEYPPGITVLDVSGHLQFGNHQAHKQN